MATMVWSSLMVSVWAASTALASSGESGLLLQVEENATRVMDRIHVAPGSPAPVRLAAEDLRRYLHKSLGVDLPITDGAPGSGAVFIATRGDAPDDPEMAGAFLGKGFDQATTLARNGGLCIVGENPRATLYGVYDFLQAELKIRFFGPGEDHEVVPSQTRVVLPVNYTRTRGSAFEFREYYLPKLDSEATVDFLMKNRVNTFCVVASPDEAPEAIRRRGGLVHGPGHIFREFLPDPALFEPHPEYFPMVDGVRKVNGTGACFSNPDVRRMFTDRVRDYVKARPFWDIFALWAEDTSYAAYCECPECAKVSTAGWYMTLVNDVAPVIEEELPGALFEFIAYHETRWPPQEVMPLYKNGKNMILNICIGYTRNGFYPLTSRRDGNAEVLDMYEAWSKRLEEIGFEGRRILFDYYNRCEIAAGHGPSGQALLWPMEVIAEDTRFYWADGIRGIADWVCFDRLCWPTPFNLWAWLQLYSSPGLAISDLEDDFYAAYFKNAGEAVRDYSRALQEVMYADTSAENIERVARLRGNLDTLLVGETDPVIRHRLEVVANHHEYCLLLKRIWLAFIEQDEAAWQALMPVYNDFYTVTHRELLANEIDIPSQFMNIWYEYHLKRPKDQIPEQLRNLVAIPSSR